MNKYIYRYQKTFSIGSSSGNVGEIQQLMDLAGVLAGLTSEQQYIQITKVMIYIRLCMLDTATVTASMGKLFIPLVVTYEGDGTFTLTEGSAYDLQAYLIGALDRDFVINQIGKAIPLGPYTVLNPATPTGTLVGAGKANITKAVQSWASKYQGPRPPQFGLVAQIPHLDIAGLLRGSDDGENVYCDIFVEIDADVITRPIRL